MRRIVWPDELRPVFGSDGCSRRAFMARIERAEARGTLPARVYISPRRFGWDAAELEAALAKLPRSYAGFAAQLGSASPA